MMTKTAKKLLNIAQLVMFLLIPAVMFAPPLPPGPGNTVPVPIDSGLYFLVIAGVIFGMKKLIDFKKAQA